MCGKLWKREIGQFLLKGRPILSPPRVKLLMSRHNCSSRKGNIGGNLRSRSGLLLTSSFSINVLTILVSYGEYRSTSVKRLFTPER